MNSPKLVHPSALGAKVVPLGTMLRDSARLLEQEERTALPKTALDPYLVSYLWRINARPGLTLSEYSKSHGIDLASYSRWACKLIEMGYLQKHQDELDSRRRRLQLTDAGRGVLERSLQSYESVERMVEARMGPGSYQQFRKMLATFIVTIPKS